MAEAVTWPAETFNKQLLNKNSDLTALESVLSAVKTLGDVLGGTAAETLDDVWAFSKS